VDRWTSRAPVRAAASATFAAPSAHTAHESSRLAALTITAGRRAATTASTAARSVMSRSADDVPITS
jgi:hypothetical protein